MTLRRAVVGLAAAAALLMAGCGGEDPPPEAPGVEDLSVTSSAFGHGAVIPGQHTCDGGNLAPALVWSGEPEGTAGFAVVMTDPDAGDFVHWVAFDIAATEHALDPASAAGATLGENSFGNIGYDGPCPPEGDEPHRYRFTVYALSRLLGLEAGASYDDVRAGLDDAALASGTLEGSYGR